MGSAVLKELSQHLDLLNLRLLIYEKIIPSNISTIIKNNKSSIEIIKGDLRNYDTILKCITGADYVLHVGGMVSPYADKFPYETLEVNVGGMKNIVKAVLAQENKDSIKVCYIGSVAETGGRNYPYHYGRIGDPINISIYDHYALSKAMAEMILVDSGIKNWVVLRMTGIIHAGLFNNMKPIVMHVVINGGLEWCTQEDSGRVLRQLVLLDIDGKLGKDFWNHMFNISSGKDYRFSNYLLGYLQPLERDILR
jgi:nucleoside-diphosphate-sugar epimerase